LEVTKALKWHLVTSQQVVTEEAVWSDNRGRRNTNDELDEENKGNSRNTSTDAPRPGACAVAGPRQIDDQPSEDGSEDDSDSALLAATTDKSTDGPRPGAFAMRGRRQMEDDLSVEAESDDDTEEPVPLTANDSSTPHMHASVLRDEERERKRDEAVRQRDETVYQRDEALR
jgi:hypothetical protein